MSYSIAATETLTGPVTAPPAAAGIETVVERTTVRAPSGATTSVTTITHRSVHGDADRPVVFVFNGGPGAASAFLDYGLFGPRRIDLPDPLRPPGHPPFSLLPAVDSPLDVADVVMIDPPGTGINRVAEDAAAPFLSTAGDAQALLVVVADWCRRHDRENAPRFLAGESYGTVRIAAMLARAVGGPVQGGVLRGLGFNGVLMLGSGLDLGRQGNGDLRFVNAFSGMAATAWYHGAVDTRVSLSEHTAAAERFARGELLGLLYDGYALGGAEIRRAADAVSALIGIRADVVAAHRLRIDAGLFARTLLADRGLRVGVYDARYTAPLRADAGDPVADDPAMGRYSAAFSWAGRHGLRSLGVSEVDDYRLVDFAAVNGRWDWGFGPGVPVFGDAIADLAGAMSRNPGMRAFFGTGCYDLATPIGAAAYAATHLTEEQDRVDVHVYESGHMPYLGDEPRAALAADVRAFLTGSRDE